MGGGWHIVADFSVNRSRVRAHVRRIGKHVPQSATRHPLRARSTPANPRGSFLIVRSLRGAASRENASLRPKILVQRLEQDRV